MAASRSFDSIMFKPQHFQEAQQEHCGSAELVGLPQTLKPCGSSSPQPQCHTSGCGTVCSSLGPGSAPVSRPLLAVWAGEKMPLHCQKASFAVLRD